MLLKINSQIFDKFSDLQIGVVAARGINNQRNNPELSELIKEQTQNIRNDFQIDTLSSDPKFDIWRQAYALFGAKPKKNQCSVENLYRMILEGVDIRPINQIVDIYNYISLKHAIPVGGDDADKISGDIELKFAQGTESFTCLNSDLVTNPKPGEVIYTDSQEVLCRRWNWRECDKSKMTPESKNIILVVEGLPPFSSEQIEAICDELGGLVKKYCGGEVQTYLLNKNNKNITINYAA